MTDAVELSAVNLYIGGELYKILGAKSDEYIIPIGSDFAVGKYDIEIRATSATREKASKRVTLEILKQ